MKRYLNWNRETIDELDSSDFPTEREFYAETRRLRAEYAMAGMPGRWQQKRCSRKYG